MIQFIHTADIHFGMENYGSVDPVTGIHSRLTDFVRAFDVCINTAIERNVDFFLFCGDAYKTAHPSQTHQRMLIHSFLRLHKAHIPVIIIIGNHDHPLSFGKTNALDIFNEFSLDLFHVIAKPTSIQLQTKHGPVNIVGIPWPTRNNISLINEHTSSSAITDYISQAVVRIITEQAAQLDPSIPAVLAGHLTVSSGIFSGSEKRAIYGTDPLFLPSQLAINPFDYVALGHLHRHQNLNDTGTVPIVYAGSIERIDFGERKDEKGFCLVSIEQKNQVHYEFMQVPTRPFVQIEIQLTPNQSQTEQVIAEINRHNIVKAIVKIIYKIPEKEKDLVDMRAVQHACESAHEIVGIIPVHVTTPRTRCIQDVHVGMDIQTVLNSYFQTKKELIKRKEVLVEKALSLLNTAQEE